MSKLTMLKFTQIILVSETNLQRVRFANPQEAADLVQRLVEFGFKPNMPATFAYASSLVKAGIYTAEQIEQYGEACRKSRQGRLDLLKSKASESDAAQVAYDAYKAMYANGTDIVPKFGKDAVIINDGNQRTNLMHDVETIRQLAMMAEAKRLGTKYKPEYTLTIPAEEHDYTSGKTWFVEQANSNAVSESRVNHSILDRIKLGTEGFIFGLTFDSVSSLMPAGSTRQRAPYAAYVNRITNGELLRRMMLSSDKDEYIPEGNIFASGLKDKMTLDDRIQVVVAKFDGGRRAYIKSNNEKEWNAAAKGETSKAIPQSLIAIDNGTAPEWKLSDVMAWMDSITKKGMESRASTVGGGNTAATEAVQKLQNDSVTLAKMAGGDAAANLVKGATGNDAERKAFSDKMAHFGPVLEVVTSLFDADQKNTIALADVLRGVDVKLLPAVIAAVSNAVKPAPQGGKRPAKKSVK